MWHTSLEMASAERQVSVGPQGRIVIPAGIRRALGLVEGTRLAVRAEEGRLILEPREEVLRRIRGRYARVAGKRRLSDELIRERRLEARRESAR
jgi:AbrB family looped-hinge helix DNA binding protein